MRSGERGKGGDERASRALQNRGESRLTTTRPSDPHGPSNKGRLADISVHVSPFRSPSLALRSPPPTLLPELTLGTRGGERAFAPRSNRFLPPPGRI